MKTVDDQVGDAESEVRAAQDNLKRLIEIQRRMSVTVLVADLLHARLCQLPTKDCNWSPERYVGQYAHSPSSFGDHGNQFISKAEIILEIVEGDSEKAISWSRYWFLCSKSHK